MRVLYAACELRITNGRSDWTRTSVLVLPKHAPCHWATDRLHGARDEDRTRLILLDRQVLSPESDTCNMEDLEGIEPIHLWLKRPGLTSSELQVHHWCAWEESNLSSVGYQPTALPLSYTRMKWWAMDGIEPLAT